MTMKRFTLFFLATLLAVTAFAQTTRPIGVGRNDYVYVYLSQKTGVQDSVSLHIIASNTKTTGFSLGTPMTFRLSDTRIEPSLIADVEAEDNVNGIRAYSSIKLYHYQLNLSEVEYVKLCNEEIQTISIADTAGETCFISIKPEFFRNALKSSLKKLRPEKGNFASNRVQDSNASPMATDREVKYHAIEGERHKNKVWYLTLIGVPASSAVIYAGAAAGLPGVVVAGAVCGVYVCIDMIVQASCSNYHLKKAARLLE